MSAHTASLLVLLSLWPGLLAQQPQATEAVITEARVREVVTWLASDERGGRDCPSPGLEAAAAWLQQRMQGAGVEPGVDGTWLHRFTLPGQRLDSRTLKVTVDVEVPLESSPGVPVEVDGVPQTKRVTVELAGDTDVRLLRAGPSAEGRDDDAILMRSGDPRLDGALGRGGGRRATLIELQVEHPLWTASAGVRDVLLRRLRGSSPLFAVREGVLPALPAVAAADIPTAARVSWTGAGAEAAEIGLSNVVGIVRGDPARHEYIVVSAHYDHLGIGVPVDGDAIRNGADDDASGTTAVVLLAEALARGPKLRRSVAFVCFAAEEKGLRGSSAFVEHPPFPLEAITAVVNIEMIGRPEPGKQRAAWITGREFSDFAAIAGPALQKGGIELVDFGQARQLFAQSDNLSFARKGVVAHSISAGSLHADYHQPSDSVDKLDLPHMTAVIQGLEHVVRELADGDVRPAWSDEGKKELERLQRPR